MNPQARTHFCSPPATRSEGGSDAADAIDTIAADFCAVFVLDATGVIVATNASARHLTRGERKSFVGLAFAELFEPSEDEIAAPTLDAAWKTLKNAALYRTAALPVRLDRGCARAGSVRIERALGGAGSFIATVRLGAAAQ